MSEYANVKCRKIVGYLKKLAKKNTDFEIIKASKHLFKIRCIHNGQSQPIPANHSGDMAPIMVEKIMKKLVDWEICTKEEFDMHI